MHFKRKFGLPNDESLSNATYQKSPAAYTNGILVENRVWA
jgi:hypothetical protein